MSVADKARRYRRENGPWSAAEEADWLTKHPEDAGTPHAPISEAEAGARSPGSASAGATADAAAAAAPGSAQANALADENPDLIPDVETEFREDPLAPILDGFDIIDAYNKWCGKSRPKNTNRTEGIKVSCPNPPHLDRNPSAWINTDKQTWYCGACDIGGDKYDIAAWHFGFPVPGYKDKEHFPKLREAMAADLGYVVSTTAAGSRIQEVITDPDELPPAEAELPTQPQNAEPLTSGNAISTPKSAAAPAPGAIVTDSVDPSAVSHLTLVGESNIDEPGSLALLVPSLDDLVTPSIDWRSLLPGNTFLDSYMNATSKDDLPEEYYFWQGLQALGLALSRDVYLSDSPPVRGNLFVCLYGPSGIGKSRSISSVRRLLDEAMPYDQDTNNGVMLVPSPGSAETLIDSFSYEILNPSTNEIEYYDTVTGFVEFDELSTLIGRAQRTGNPIKPTLMQFYDAYGDVTHKTRGAGLVIAGKPFASAITTTQPKAVRDLLSQTDVDSGFINRWVYAMGPHKTPIAYGRDEINLTIPVEELRKVGIWSKRGAVMELTGDAEKIFGEFFHDVIVPTKTDEDAVLLTRTDLLMKKLILLFTANEREAHPAVRHVEMALSLWDYIKDTYAMLGNEIGQGQLEECRSRIAETCLTFEARNGKPATLRDIKRGIARWRFPIEIIEKTVRLMIAIEELEEKTYSHQKSGGTVKRLKYSA